MSQSKVNFRRERHLSPSEVSAIANWIMDQPNLTTWSEVQVFVKKQFGVERTVEGLRRIPDLKNARKAKAEQPRTRTSAPPRPTTRKIDALQGHIDRLEAEIRLLKAENQTLLERNLRLINGARVHQIPESDLDRPLTPINRNPTIPRTRGKPK